MDYTLEDLAKAAEILKDKCFGKKDEYAVSFTKEDDGCWYVDYPNWPFDHHNLMMVSGADELCEMLSYDGTHTKIKVYPGLNNPKTIDEAWKRFRCKRLEWSLTGGATYLPHFSGSKQMSTGTFWLCPVTLFVLGEYPDTMWVEPLELSKGKMFDLGLRP